MQQNRKCNRCFETKCLSSYYRHKHRVGGHSYTCKDCENVVKKKWNKKNVEKIKQARKLRQPHINKKQRDNWDSRKEREKYFKRKYLSYWESAVLIEEIYKEIRKQYPNKKERHKQYISYQRHIDRLLAAKRNNKTL